MWLKRIEEMLRSTELKPSMRKFLESVKRMIEFNSLIYPTERQVSRLLAIWTYHRHRCGQDQWAEVLR